MDDDNAILFLQMQLFHYESLVNDGKFLSHLFVSGRVYHLWFVSEHI